MGGLTGLDLFLAIGLAAGAWRGARTGALRQAAGLVGLVAAVWAGALFMHAFGEAVVGLLGLPAPLAPVVGFVAICVLVAGGLLAVAHAASRVLRALRLDFLDWGIGGLVGGVRAAVVLSVLLLVTSSTALPGNTSLFVDDEARERSALYGPMTAVAPAVWDAFRALVPGWHEALRDRFAESDTGD